MNYSDLNLLPTSKRDAILTDLDAIDVSLYNLFLTEPGTDLFRPTRGLGFRRWLFMPYQPQLEVGLEVTIRTQIASWEPRISVVSCTISFYSNYLEINLAYKPKDSNLKSPREFKIKGRRGG